MKGVLQSFIDESTKDGESVPAAAANDLVAVKKPATLSTGQMLLSGCNDWENSTSKSPAGLDKPHRVDLGAEVSKVYSSSSSMHEFILMADGSIRAMGRNDRGQLGVGDTNTRALPVPVDIQSREKVVKITSGRSHSLVLLANGEVWGCGANNFGQIGLGNNKNVLKDITKFNKVAFPVSSTEIVDIACGYDFSLACTADGFLYAFGHPEYGVLGQGTDGQFIKDGGKGAALQYSCEYTPKRIEKFLTKDAHGKVTATVEASAIKIRAVAAGKNHALCLEDWQDSEDGTASLNRVYSWGWGGYGRLGHNAAQDEFFPREVTTFSNFAVGPGGVRVQVAPVNKQKQIREIICGSSFSLAVSESRHLYYWGKMSNAPRGEATTYPQMTQELFDYPVRHVSAGSNLVVVIAGVNDRAKGINGAVAGPCVGIAWGAPVSGKLGLEGDARSSTNPKRMSALDGLNVLRVSCGYGHVSMVACNEELERETTATSVGTGAVKGAGASTDFLATFPVLSALPAAQGVKSATGAGKKKAQAGGAQAQPAGKKAKK